MLNKVLLVLPVAHLAEKLAELSTSEPIQDPVYKLSIFPAPSDEKMVVIPKKERSYSTNPRHSKVPRRK